MIIIIRRCCICRIHSRRICSRQISSHGLSRSSGDMSKVGSNLSCPTCRLLAEGERGDALPSRFSSYYGQIPSCNPCGAIFLASWCFQLVSLLTGPHGGGQQGGGRSLGLESVTTHLLVTLHSDGRYSALV